MPIHKFIRKGRRKHETTCGCFFGGKATEHEVSVISAIQAIENMDKDKYEIIPIYIAKDETFYTAMPYWTLKIIKI